MQMNPISKDKKHAWLLKRGLFLVPLSICLLLIQIAFSGGIEHLEMPPDTSGKSHSVLTVVLIAIIGVFIVPFYEEFLFRGVFLKRKIWIYTALIGSILFTLLMEPNGFSNYLLIPYLCAFLIWFYTGRKTKGLFKIVLLLNAIFFESLHHQLIDFNYLVTYILFLMGIGFVFIAQWLVFNYTLLYSMTFHSIWNGLVFGLILFDLQIPNKTFHRAENEYFYVEWQEAPLFANKKVYFLEDTKQYKTYLIKDLALRNQDTLSSIFGTQYYQTNLNQRYDFLIKPKKKDLAAAPHNYFNRLYELLWHEGLLEQRCEPHPK